MTKAMMTNLQGQIKQQEAAVQHMQMLVSAGRARAERLEAAQNELSRLRQLATEPAEQVAESAQPARRTSRKVKAIMQDVSLDSVQMKQRALSEEAHRIRKDQADLSNLLHKVPADQPCPELTERILDMHHQVESLWDEKLFLERNEHDSPEQPADDQLIQPRKVDDIKEKAALTVEIQKLREKRSKLKRKLDDPKASQSRKVVWGIQLAQTEAQIEELSTRRNLV